MKVVVLHPPLYPVNHKFFNELGKHLDLTVFSFGNSPGLHKQWKVSNFINQENTYKLEIIEGKTNLKRYAVSYRTQMNPSFLLKVKKEKPDFVISVAFWFPSFYMALLKPFFKSKLIILTDAIEYTEKNNSRARKFIRNIIAKKATAFIAGSDLTVSYLQKLYPKNIIKKSTQTIDVTQWKSAINALPEKVVLKKELGFSKNKVSLLSIGNFIPLKNLKKLIKEIIEMPNCELFLIGDGDLKDDFDKKIEDHNAADKIKLIERQHGDELKKYYKASDLFIFPSKRDTFGYVVVEALASGLPVICSKNAGASTLIDTNKNGLLISPDDDFKVAIKAVINKLPEMSLNALESVSKYTIEEKANSFYNLLSNIE